MNVLLVDDVLLQVRMYILSHLQKRKAAHLPHISCECILIERIAEVTKFHSPL